MKDCERCELPELFKKLEEYRNIAQMADVNALASESPIQAAPCEPQSRCFGLFYS